MFEIDEICAIIVTNGFNDNFIRCIDSVINQNYTPKEIYVVNTNEFDKKLQNVVDSANIGLAKQKINTSIILKNATGAKNFAEAVNSLVFSGEILQKTQWMWLLYDDSVAESKALNALVNEVQISETIGIVGSKQVESDTNTLINVGWTTSRFGKRYSLIGREQVDQGQYSRIEDVLAVSMNGALLNVEQFMKIGGFCEKTGLNNSLEYCRRLHLSGKRVIVSSGATVFHKQLENSKNSLYNLKKSDILYRLSTVRLPLLPILWLILLITNPFVAIKQLYSDNKGSVKVFFGCVVALFSFASIFEIRKKNSSSKKVPRSVISSLFVKNKQIKLIKRDQKLENAANLWEEYQPTLLQSQLLKKLAKKRNVAFAGVVTLLILLTFIHFASSFGEIFIGGHFESKALTGSQLGALDGFNAFWSGYSDVNFGYKAPVNGVIFLISLFALIFGSIQNAINVFVLLATLFAGITAWVCSGAATRNNSARILATLTWISLPMFTNSLDEGRIGACFAHILLPLLPYFVARGLGKASTDLDIGLPKLTYSFAGLGIVLALIWCAQPILILPTLVCMCIAGFWNRRFLFALIPGVVLNFPLMLWVITNLHNNSWQIFFGDSSELSDGARKNVFQIVFGSGSFINLSAIISLFVIVVSALFMLKATRTARIILSRFLWTIAVISLGIAILIERNSLENASTLVSVAYLCFITTIIIFLNQRLCFEKKAIIVYFAVCLCVILISISYVVFETSRDLRVVSDYSLPVIAQKISNEEGNPHVLVLNEDSKGLKYQIVSSRNFDFVNNSDAAQIIINNTDINEKDQKLREAVANMLSAPNQQAIKQLEELGIKAIYVPDVEDNLFIGSHEKLLKAIDSTPGIIRVIEGKDRGFWRLPTLPANILFTNTNNSEAILSQTLSQDAQINVNWDNQEGLMAYSSFEKYLNIAISIITLLIYLLLAMPFGKRKVVKYDL